MSPTIPGLLDVLAVLAAEAVGTAAATAVTRVLVAIASTRLRQRHLVARVCNTCTCTRTQFKREAKLAETERRGNWCEGQHNLRVHVVMYM